MLFSVLYLCKLNISGFLTVTLMRQISFFSNFQDATDKDERKFQVHSTKTKYYHMTNSYFSTQISHNQAVCSLFILISSFIACQPSCLNLFCIFMMHKTAQHRPLKTTQMQVQLLLPTLKVATESSPAVTASSSTQEKAVLMMMLIQMV